MNGLEERYVRAFDSWIYKMGFRSRKAALMFLCHAMYDKRLFVMDLGTKEILVGAARDDTMAEARRIAREEARIVLWEEGFISDANCGIHNTVGLRQKLGLRLFRRGPFSFARMLGVWMASNDTPHNASFGGQYPVRVTVRIYVRG